MSNLFEEKARTVVEAAFPISGSASRYALVEAISAALVSVQRETMEADAKIADRFAGEVSVDDDPWLASSIAAAIRSQGTDHG